MAKPKVHRDGWATAQVPHLISAPSGVVYVSPRDKHAEAETLRAQVEAHLQQGGAVEVLTAPTPRRGFAKRATRA